MPIIDIRKCCMLSKMNIAGTGASVLVAILITAIVSFPTNFAFAQTDQQAATATATVATKVRSLQYLSNSYYDSWQKYQEPYNRNSKRRT